MAGFLALSAPAAAKSAIPGVSNAERAIVREINSARASFGRPRVSLDRGLTRASDKHCRDMRANSFIEHTSSDGTTFDERIIRYADRTRLGEVLAAVPERSGANDRIIDLWLNSPPHRVVLLDRKFRRVGAARCWGELDGTPASFVAVNLSSVD